MFLSIINFDIVFFLGVLKFTDVFLDPAMKELGEGQFSIDADLFVHSFKNFSLEFFNLSKRIAFRDNFDEFGKGEGF